MDIEVDSVRMAAGRQAEAGRVTLVSRSAFLPPWPSGNPQRCRWTVRARELAASPARLAVRATVPPERRDDPEVKAAADANADAVWPDGNDIDPVHGRGSDVLDRSSKSGPPGCSALDPVVTSDSRLSRAWPGCSAAIATISDARDRAPLR